MVNLRRPGGKVLRILRKIVLVLGFWGCAAAPQSTAPAPQVKNLQAPHSAQLHRGPLTDYVPAAGLRYLLCAKPRALLQDLNEELKPLVSAQRLESFHSSSGLDLRSTSNALIAGFDFGTLYGVELNTGQAPVVRSRFAARLLTEPNERGSEPGIHWISGVIGKTPQALVVIEERLMFVAVGDPSLLRVVVAFAQERLKRSPTALRGVALSTLPLAQPDQLVSLYIPGPLPDWDLGIISTAQALAVTLRAPQKDQLVLRFLAAGEFTDLERVARAELNQLWSTVARSAFANRNAPQPQAQAVRADASLLELELSFETRDLVLGLAPLFGSDAAHLADWGAAFGKSKNAR